MQATPPKSPSLPPDSQKIAPAIIEAIGAQTSDVQTLKDILYNAHDVRFEVRDDTPCLLYKELEEVNWVPIIQTYIHTYISTDTTCAQHVNVGLPRLAPTSLITRSSLHPVFGHLQYAELEGKGLGFLPT